MVGCALCEGERDGIVHDLLHFFFEVLDFGFGKMFAVDQMIGEQLACCPVPTSANSSGVGY